MKTDGRKQTQPRLQYDEQTRARTLALLASGMSTNRVAHICGVDNHTVTNWKIRYGVDTEHTLSKEHIRSIGDKILEYMHEQVDTLIAQQRFARNEEWLAKQGASELAAFQQTTHRNLVNLLAAQQRAEERRQQMEQQERMLEQGSDPPEDYVEGSYQEADAG